ncbi:hypothetical protein CCB80_11200 [Armatimonadetes bacterium Uphvl-Ar1]|nr:hypothetical protein CCB80_11200 [Armatimonadetes bacterium Uphvl-Ar1]
MRVIRLSESCIIFKELSTDPAPIANSLNQTPPPGLIEAVPAFNQLALYFDPNDFDTLALRDFVPNNSPNSVSVEKELGDQMFDPNLESAPLPLWGRT